MNRLIYILLFISFFCFAQVEDFISGVELNKLYTDELSLDFVVLGIHGRERKLHYDSCRLKSLSFYHYNTTWNINHLGQNIDSQKKTRIAFLNKDNSVIEVYQPFINGYDYYLGNGFAFDDLNTFLDYNKDGYLDRRIMYTKLDYHGSHHLINAISQSILSDYHIKIQKGEIQNNIGYDDYEKNEWMLNNNFELFGFGYLTRYSKQGFVYFIIEH